MIVELQWLSVMGLKIIQMRINSLEMMAQDPPLGTDDGRFLETWGTETWQFGKGWREWMGLAQEVADTQMEYEANLAANDKDGGGRPMDAWDLQQVRRRQNARRRLANTKSPSPDPSGTSGGRALHQFPDPDITPPPS